MFMKISNKAVNLRDVSRYSFSKDTSTQYELIIWYKGCEDYDRFNVNISQASMLDSTLARHIEVIDYRGFRIQSVIEDNPVTGDNPVKISSTKNPKKRRRYKIGLKKPKAELVEAELVESHSLAEEASTMLAGVSDKEVEDMLGVGRR